MERLKQFSVFADGHAEEKTVATRTDDTLKPNDFGGIAPGGIAVFQQDVEDSQGELIDSIAGCRFIMVSTKLFLWNLQTETLNIYGINNPFACNYYSNFLEDNLEEYHLDVLLERMEHYSVPPGERPILFGVNDVIKILPAQLEDRYIIIHLDGEKELIANPNIILKSKDLLSNLYTYAGKKTWAWIKKKVFELTGEADA